MHHLSLEERPAHAIVYKRLLELWVSLALGDTGDVSLQRRRRGGHIGQSHMIRIQSRRGLGRSLTCHLFTGAISQPDPGSLARE